MYNCGLVLEGGGSRAIYTSGVLDAFMEQDLDFDYVIGVSAGSCNGISFVSKNIRRQHDITINYVNDKRYMSINSMVKNGQFLNYDWIFDELSFDLMPINLEKLKSSTTTLISVVTNAKTGQAEYLQSNEQGEIRGCPKLKASCALPFAAKGVKINGNTYYDGGVADSIPAKRAKQDGCKKQVIILTQDANYVKQPLKADFAIHKRFDKEFPKLADALLNRHNMYNEQLEFIRGLEKTGEAYVIRPAQPLHCGTLEKNVEKLESIYQLGYKQGLENIDNIKKFLTD